MKTASITLHRMAKKTSELTSQVEPNNSANVTRLRVSSSMNAAPRKNMCAVEALRARLRRQAEDQPQRDHADHGQPEDVRERQAGARRYISGHSSVASVGGAGSVAGRVVVAPASPGRPRQQDGVGISFELRRWRADSTYGRASSGRCGQQRVHARTVDQHASASPAAVAHRIGRLTESLSSMPASFRSSQSSR